MAFDQSAQLITVDGLTQRKLRREHTYRSIFQRQLFKLRVKTSLMPNIPEGQLPPRREWVEHRYQDFFFQSYKSIKTTGWFPHIPDSVRTRKWREQYYPFLFYQSYLVPKGVSVETSGGSSEAGEGYPLSVSHSERIKWYNYISAPFWTSSRLPKLGAKTRGDLHK